MKLHRVYNIVVNDIIVFTSTSIQAIMHEFADIVKSEPRAWIQTCYN